MTGLLQKAIDELQKLPPHQQDEMAKIILDELADETRWDQVFAASQDKLSKLAAKVRGDIRNGKVRKMGIDEL